MQNSSGMGLAAQGRFYLSHSARVLLFYFVELTLVMQSLDIQPLVFDREQMTEARAAWRRFGKGRHPAALNLGDCCAYAVALTRAEPLLYKGQDFSKTDITAAEW
jgi:ribonuclease VapC